MKKLAIVAVVLGLLAGCDRKTEVKAEPKDQQEAPKVEVQAEPQKQAKKPAVKVKVPVKLPKVYAHELFDLAAYQHGDFVNRYYNRDIIVIGKVDVAHKGTMGTFLHLMDNQFKKNSNCVSCRFEGDEAANIKVGDWVAVTGRCQGRVRLGNVKVEPCIKAVKIEEPKDLTQLPVIPE